jgi:hypothetical protein
MIAFPISCPQQPFDLTLPLSLLARANEVIK